MSSFGVVKAVAALGCEFYLEDLIGFMCRKLWAVQTCYAEPSAGSSVFDTDEMVH